MDRKGQRTQRHRNERAKECLGGAHRKDAVRKPYVASTDQPNDLGEDDGNAPASWLLQLVPQFTDGLKSALAPSILAPAPTFFSNPEEGPAVVDTSSPAISVIIKGRELPGTILDGGSGVHVISLQTFNTLGIQEWEPCPFWLRMVDTSLIWPTGLIRDLEVTIEGHAIRISAVVLQLNTQGAYPLLLGRPWLRTEHIKQNWQKNTITFRHCCKILSIKYVYNTYSKHSTSILTFS